MNLFDGRNANHILMNRYEPGQGIMVSAFDDMKLDSIDHTNPSRPMKMVHFSIQP